MSIVEALVLLRNLEPQWNQANYFAGDTQFEQ